MPPNAKTLIITEGEIDALSWFGFGRCVMSVPFGGGKGEKQAWIENEFDRLQVFERIYLSLDMDGPGEEAANEIASRLGRHRCLRVTLSHKDANECLMQGVGVADMQRALDRVRLSIPRAFTAHLIMLSGLRPPSGPKKATAFLTASSKAKYGFAQAT